MNAQFAFANNIPKQFVQSFHQISIFVSYESLCCGLQANAKTVIEAILEKTQNRQFFISYNNMNFYKNVRDQQIFNCSALINYTARCICFMKTPNGIENLDHSWEDQYLDRSQIDRRLVNQLRKKDFELTQADFDHRSAVVQYSISGVLEQYFAIAMQKQKNDRNILIYRKWALPLPDIRCSFEKANLLPLLTLAYNKGTILGTINIIRELAEQLELTNEVVRDKIIFIKRDLMTIQNCCCAIYWRQDELLPLDRFQ